MVCVSARARVCEEGGGSRRSGTKECGREGEKGKASKSSSTKMGFFGENVSFDPPAQRCPPCLRQQNVSSWRRVRSLCFASLSRAGHGIEGYSCARGGGRRALPPQRRWEQSAVSPTTRRCGTMRTTQVGEKKKNRVTGIVGAACSATRRSSLPRSFSSLALSLLTFRRDRPEAENHGLDARVEDGELCSLHR